MEGEEPINWLQKFKDDAAETVRHRREAQAYVVNASEKVATTIIEREELDPTLIKSLSIATQINLGKIEHADMPEETYVGALYVAAVDTFRQWVAHFVEPEHLNQLVREYGREVRRELELKVE